MSVPSISVREASARDTRAMAGVIAEVAEEGSPPCWRESPEWCHSRWRSCRKRADGEAVVHWCRRRNVTPGRPARTSWSSRFWPDNARAIALYATTGFEVEGLRRDHYRRRDGSLRSALIMAKLLV